MADSKSCKVAVTKKVAEPTTLEDEEEGAAKHASAPGLNSTAQDETKAQSVLFGVALYAVCSSTLLLINKVSLHLVPDASFILFCQFLSSALFVRALKRVSPAMDIELLQPEKAKMFFLACMVFFLCLLSNTEALRAVNVETVIVARSSSPIAVSVLEHFTLGKALPNFKGMLSLATIASGAVLYVLTDAGFKVEGYLWLAAYFVFIVIEMVFVKFVVSTVPMSTWTRVYYNNAMSIPMVVVASQVMGFGGFMQVDWGIEHIVAIAVSCIVGIAISYAGFNLRKLVSATSFSVIGVMCKLITVLLNDVIWTHHSNLMGHLGLLLCITAGYAYEKTKST